MAVDNLIWVIIYQETPVRAIVIIDKRLQTNQKSFQMYVNKGLTHFERF